MQTAALYGIDEDRAVEFRNDSDGQALNYRVVSEAVACVRASAPMSADWKDAIEQDFRRRGGRK